MKEHNYEAELGFKTEAEHFTRPAFGVFALMDDAPERTIMTRFIYTIAVAAAFLMIAVGTPSAATMQSSTNRYGGPTYGGTPALAVTAALVRAGGGAGHFSLAQALTSMVGTQTVNTEVRKLTQQYGKAAVDTWLSGFNFAVEDALQVATKAGVQLPPPADLQGQKLAAALVDAGVDPKTNVFWSGLLYDKALSHGIHNQVMDDIDQKYGATTDLTVHRITNQAMCDLAHALGETKVQVAPLH